MGQEFLMCKRIETKLASLFGIIEEKLTSGGEVGFSPNGISMLPLIKPGCDRITLKRNEKNIQKYDIAFYKRPDGKFVLHRIIKKCSDGSFVMCGDNQFVLERNVSPEWVIAVVSKLEKNGKTVDFGGIGYKIYCRHLVLRRLYLRYKQRGFVPRAFRKFKRILKNKQR